MDESEFFARLREMDAREGAPLGDIRAGVWRRIAALEKAGTCLDGYCLAAEADGRYVFGMGMAAAATLAATAGFLYHNTLALMWEVAFNQPLYELFAGLQ